MQSTDGHMSCDAGHRHWGLAGAAGLLVFNRGADGVTRFLLQHRSPLVDCGDTWAIPGGALHEGETAVEGALREAVEELGALPPMLVDSLLTDDHGGWAYTTVIVEAVDCFKLEPTGWETGSEGAQWLSEDEILTLRLHPGFAASWPRLMDAFSYSS